MTTLHDADRVVPVIRPRALAHSYEEEVRPAPRYDFYRPSIGDQIGQAVGCLAHMAGILIAALIVWALLAALLLQAVPA